jgi:hypothetical protein
MAVMGEFDVIVGAGTLRGRQTVSCSFRTGGQAEIPKSIRAGAAVERIRKWNWTIYMSYM